MVSLIATLNCGMCEVNRALDSGGKGASSKDGFNAAAL